MLLVRLFCDFICNCDNNSIMQRCGGWVFSITSNLHGKFLLPFIKVQIPRKMLTLGLFLWWPWSKEKKPGPAGQGLFWGDLSFLLQKSMMFEKKLCNSGIYLYIYMNIHIYIYTCLVKFKIYTYIYIYTYLYTFKILQKNPWYQNFLPTFLPSTAKKVQVQTPNVFCRPTSFQLLMRWLNEPPLTPRGWEMAGNGKVSVLKTPKTRFD